MPMKQLSLIPGVEPPVEKSKTLRRIVCMHKRFGVVDDRKCKDCAFLIKQGYNRSYYKCIKYGDTRSEATDWRLGWTACGLWEPAEAIAIFDKGEWIPEIQEDDHA
jgi:hypothetical protein